jgi:hypothetical protein
MARSSSFIYGKYTHRPGNSSLVFANCSEGLVGCAALDAIGFPGIGYLVWGVGFTRNANPATLVCRPHEVANIAIATLRRLLYFYLPEQRSC